MDNGLVHIRSRHSVRETIQRLESLLKEKGIKIFSRIDHSGEAEKLGLHMRPTQVIIFGNPQAGTPIMVESPSAAIDLPLKALVWEDDKSNVWISYNNPEYLQQRHNISMELIGNISGVGTLLQKVGES